MTLQDLGWTPAFEQALAALERPDLVPARVTRQDAARYGVVGAEGPWTAVLTGRLRQDARSQAELPAVGDWVAVTPPGDGGLATVYAVLPRAGVFSRKVAGQTTDEQVVAANVDTVFLVSGLDGDFNPRRIERYVTLAWNSGAVPVIVLNKVDLCDDLADRLQAVEAVAMGLDVLTVSALDGDGVDALRDHLAPGRTVAFLGSSGVGKSTLVNRLLGTDRMATHAVRQDDSRGRHTTTFRELIPVPDGGLVIDTPGMRELQLWTDEEGLRGAFADVESLAAGCRFRDCTHTSEPGCAVLDAVETGALDPGRLAGYQKLRRELDYLARRQGEASAYEERKRKQDVKRMHKEYRRRTRKR